MQNCNISDIIEQYLKELLANDQQIEIKRSEIAHRFDVVPSQINYVIKTRFNMKNGYLVESKRGGGGYIRIVKVDLLNDEDAFSELLTLIGDSIDATTALQVIQSLYQDGVITRREANLVLAAIDNETLAFNDKELANQLRARILSSILQRLRCTQ